MFDALHINATGSFYYLNFTNEQKISFLTGTVDIFLKPEKIMRRYTRQWLVLDKQVS